jgi:hypothetical protein
MSKQRDFKKMVGRTIAVHDERGLLVVRGELEYVSPEQSRVQGRSEGYYIENSQIPLTSIRSVCLDRDVVFIDPRYAAQMRQTRGDAEGLETQARMVAGGVSLKY